MGFNSKRDLVILMLLSYICVKAAAFKVSLWGTHELVGYWFILCSNGLLYSEVEH